MGRPSKLLLLFSFLVVLIPFGSGCGGETGLLIEVSRDADSTPAQIDELRFFVGVGQSAAPDSVSAFVDDAVEGDIVVVSTRDLVADPYKLLLRESDSMADGMGLMVVVLAYAGGQIVGYGGLDAPVSFVDGKVLSWPVVIRGNRGDRVDLTETGCLIWTSDTGTVVISTTADKDCDGDPADQDCDDTSPTVSHGAAEVCGNGKDDNCNGEIDEEIDQDGDMVKNCDDCDDRDPKRFPGNPEVCDGLDNDCSGACDDGDLDADEDHYSVCGRKIFGDGTCSDESDSLIDCDDENAEVHPFADEICDGWDNNCDGTCDAEFDPDMDGFTACGSIVDECKGTSDLNTDCQPDNGDVHPAATETCDGFDTNCDGEKYPEDNGCYTLDAGACVRGTRLCTDENGVGWAACAPIGAAGDPGRILPPGLCDAYAMCELNGDPDPFSCANATVTATNVACKVFYTAGEDVCKPAATMLPGAGLMAECSWGLLGEIGLSRYVAGLRALNDGSLVNWVNSCDTVFELKTATTVPPKPSGFLLHRRTGTEGSFVRLAITPELVTVCPLSGLQCMGLPAPADVPN